MKLITRPEADALLTTPIVALRLLSGTYDEKFRVFPEMRSSDQVLVFSVGFLSAVTQWWRADLASTGFKYAPGSGMCEAGSKRFIGRIMDMVQPFRGTGDVERAIIEEAQSLGHACPTERLGDFSPGVYETRGAIPSGLDVNGVTDGGHDTITVLVVQPDGTIKALLWEWQNGEWVSYEDKVVAGFDIRDLIDS